MANETGFRATKSFTREILEGSDYCEHCTEKDLSKAVGYFFERDSFGLVGAYIVCQPCREESEAAEGEQDTTCFDCKQTVKVKDTIQWRWYDFHAPQGDEPLTICTACQAADHHKQRLAKDKQDYEQEFGIGDYADDDIDDDEFDDDMLDEEEPFEQDN